MVVTGTLRWPVRLSVVSAAGAAVLLGWTAGADAHTRTEETTNIVSEVVEGPELPGVQLTVHTGGLAVELVNEGDQPVIVEGYDREPYLRIGPDGVQRNRHSAATYLNSERFGDVALPPTVDPDAPPDWVHVDDEPRWVWHDHRTHWMAPQPPRFVDAGPLARSLMDMRLVGVIGSAGEDEGPFTDWTLPLHHDGRIVEVRGQLVWEDPPSATPWLALAAVLALPAVLGLRRPDLPGLIRPAAWTVGAVAAINTIHLVDDLAAWPSEPLDELTGLLHTSIFLIGGIGGAIWALRVASGRVLALGIASASVLYHQGIVHLPMLFASGFPTVWPDGLVRLTVALGLLQAVPVALVVRRSFRRGARHGSAVDAPEVVAAP